MVWLWSDYMGFAWQIVCGVSVCTLMSKNDIFYPSHFWEPAVQSGGRKNASYVVLPQYRGTAGTTTSALHPLIVPQDTHTHTLRFSCIWHFHNSTSPRRWPEENRRLSWTDVSCVLQKGGLYRIWGRLYGHFTHFLPCLSSCQVKQEN